MTPLFETEAANTIKAALHDHTPVIAAQAEESIRRAAKYLFEDYGIALEGARKNAYHRWEYIKPFLTGEYDRGRVLSYSLNEEGIKSYCQFYAEETTKAWLAKIITKLGPISSATVALYDGRNFVIRFERDGRKCTIEQQSILKCTNRGKMFHQFPSRIYVEGQFYSERNYQALFSDKV